MHLDDVGVSYFSEGLDLPQLEALVPALVLVLHGLDGHQFLGFDVDGLVDSPKGPVPQYFYYLVLLHALYMVSRAITPADEQISGRRTHPWR